MPAIVALPQVVEELLLQFGDVFPNEPSRVHFAEYLTGLMVAEHKTVSGIAREMSMRLRRTLLHENGRISSRRLVPRSKFT